MARTWIGPTEKYPGYYQIPQQRNYLYISPWSIYITYLEPLEMPNVPLKQLGNPQKSPFLSTCASCSSACINASLNMTIISLSSGILTIFEMWKGDVLSVRQFVLLCISIAALIYHQHLLDGYLHMLRPLYDMSIHPFYLSSTWQYHQDWSSVRSVCLPLGEPWLAWLIRSVHLPDDPLLPLFELQSLESVVSVRLVSYLLHW